LSFDAPYGSVSGSSLLVLAGIPQASSQEGVLGILANVKTRRKHANIPGDPTRSKLCCKCPKALRRLLRWRLLPEKCSIKVGPGGIRHVPEYRSRSTNHRICISRWPLPGFVQVNDSWAVSDTESKPHRLGFCVLQDSLTPWGHHGDLITSLHYPG